jgi:perosamine synthetase
MKSPDFLPFALPDISEAEITSVVETLRSGWITTGPKTKEFERRFAEAVGAPHAVMLNSCTAALHLALEAVGVRGGDEVIVPAMTFAATAEVVRYFDAIPVIVDVRATDHNVDPAAVERALSPRTKAVIPVHFAGTPCDMESICAIARDRGVAVVDDAAHAFPAARRGKRVGTLADITCFSFYATKTITTAEGGAAVTAREDWADRMRVMSLHGISRDAWKRYTAEGNWYYEIVAPGFKYNLTDVASAIGLGQLARAESMRERRASISRRFDEAFRGTDALELIERDPRDEHAHHLYVVKLRPGMLSIDRGRFIEEMRKLGIGTSVHFIPLHLHPYYREQFGYAPDALPVALDLYSRSISLPVYSRMTDGDVDRVIGAVLEVTSSNRA